MLNKNSVKSEFTKPYYTLGKYSEETENIWFIFHGYGQLAEYFAKNFEDLSSNKTYFIFPQAPSKCYIDNDFNKVGASWLTKNEIEEEIENNFNYLNGILALEKIDLSKVKINGFGFSQGVSMLVRWFASKKIMVEKMILWAGKSPTTFLDDKNILSPKKLYFVMGNNDPLKEYLNLEEELPRLEKQFSVKVNFIEYEGAHKVNKEIVKHLLE